MNEKEFNILNTIKESKESIYLRAIVKKTKLPYGTVQGIINRNKHLFEIKESGKNKYYSFKTNTDNLLLFQQLEIEKTKIFLNKHQNLRPFIDECKKLNFPIVIFGSFAKNNETKNSDLDILIIGKTQDKLPEHICPIKIHKISVKSENLSIFKGEVLYNQIKSEHIIINGFDFITGYLNELPK